MPFERGEHGVVLIANPQIPATRSIRPLWVFQLRSAKGTALALVSAAYHYKTSYGSGWIVLRPKALGSKVGAEKLLYFE